MKYVLSEMKIFEVSYFSSAVCQSKLIELRIDL